MDRAPIEIHFGPLYIESGGESFRRGKWRRNDLHIWVGPLGLHLFWPDLYKSRPDLQRDWRSSRG